MPHDLLTIRWMEAFIDSIFAEFILHLIVFGKSLGYTPCKSHDSTDLRSDSHSHPTDHRPRGDAFMMLLKDRS